MSINSQRPIITYENIALVQSNAPCHTTLANSGDSLSFVPLVQSLSFSFDFPRSQQGSIGSRDLYSNSNWSLPQVQLNISTYEEFNKLFSNFLTGFKDQNFDLDRNFYALIGDKRGFDVLNASKKMTEFDVISFGNCFLSNISMSQSVPGFLSSEYSFVASNVQAQRLSTFKTNGGSGTAPSLNLTGNQSQNVPVVFNNIPSDNPQSLLSSGLFVETGGLIPAHLSTITISRANTIAKIDSIQNFSLNLPVPRKPIYSIGKRVPVIQKSIFPSIGGLNISNLLSNFSVTGQFSNSKDFLVKDDNYDVTLSFKNLRNEIEQFKIKDAKLDSNNYSIGVGESLTSDIDFSFSTHRFFKSPTNIFIRRSGDFDADGGLGFNGNGFSSGKNGGFQLVKQMSPVQDLFVTITGIFAGDNKLNGGLADSPDQAIIINSGGMLINGSAGPIIANNQITKRDTSAIAGGAIDFTISITGTPAPDNVFLTIITDED